jgi:hypothetical protein
LLGSKAAPGDLRNLVDMLARKSLKPQSLKSMLMIDGSDELELLRAGIDRVQGLSGADYNDSEHDMMSEEAQESQTKVDNIQEPQQLGLILLKCSNSVLPLL